jgi:hypothetical protein
MMARRRSPELDAAMRDWWDAIASWPLRGAALPFGLPRDQIDLPPVLRKHGIQPLEWPHGQSESPWWRRRPHGMHLSGHLDLRREIEDAAPVAIDAWSTEASVAGQEGVNAAWWQSVGDEGHERARQTLLARLKKHQIMPERCRVLRQWSDASIVPPVIDILHHDANHGPQVVLDVERWAPSVRVGGLLILNDLDWPGGHARRARDRALELGFVEQYRLGTGVVLQRC